MERFRAPWKHAVWFIFTSLFTLSVTTAGCTPGAGDATDGGRDTLPSEIINDEPSDGTAGGDGTVVADASNYALEASEDETTPGKWVFEVRSRQGTTSTTLRFVWDFGDGLTYTGTTQSFQFDTPGIHRVTLRAFTTTNALAFILTLDVEVPSPGLPPVADAGGDFMVQEGDVVTLDGTLSSDPDSTALTYAWSQIGSGPAMTLAGANSVSAGFTAPDVSIDTILQFTLTVSDGANSAQDVVLITVANGIGTAGTGPTADAGADQDALSGDTVFLDGTASSGQGPTPLLFQWTQLSGTGALISGSTSAVATFVAPSVTADEALLFRLTVFQNDLASEDQVVVTVHPNPLSPPPPPSGGGGGGGGGGTTDACPNDPNKTDPGQCGCGVADSDSDGDGMADCVDQCPNHAIKTDPGECGCAAPDTDTDDDGTPNCLDSCPTDPLKVVPGTCGCSSPETDTDGDGAKDCRDGCPADATKIAPGVCGCGIAETDTDADGTKDCIDACPNDPTKVVAGVCGCGTPDTDSDGDGTKDCNDTCPNDPLKTRPGICGCGVPDADADGDGALNCNDSCPNDAGKTTPGVCGCGAADSDLNGNGTPDCNDNCGAGLDTDGDGVFDCADGCPNDPNKTAPGACGCGAADTDSDGDGTPNCQDLCPNNAGKIAPGVCGCATPDTDSDGDGTPNCNDLCPNNAGKTSPGVCGCPTADTDSDGDGTPNCVDGCPNNAAKISPGVCGCTAPDTDSDGDGTPNCIDGCPTNAGKITPGVCGCSTPDTDSDSDGTPNCTDGCPNDPNKSSPGTCGCGVADADSDGDGRANCQDACPNDPNKFAAGACGCGVPDTDSDVDGTPNCIDGCPNDFNKTSPGLCGCGVYDIDSDSDGTANCNDACPNDPTKTGPGICGCGTSDADANGNGTPDCLETCSTNPLTDPGFESGGTGWQNTTNGGRSIVTTQHHGGAKALETIVSNQFARDVFQTVAAATGTTFDVSAWVRTSGIGGPGAGVRVDWLNASAGVIRTDVTATVLGTQTWTQVSANLTAPTGTVSVRVALRLDIDPDGVGTAWFDDVVLCDRGTQDSDGDGVPDPLDIAPNNPNLCRDTDGDGCDDCTNGTSNPANDGLDSDGDGYCNTGDACPGFDDNLDSDGDGIPDGCEPAALCASPTTLNFGTANVQMTLQAWNCGGGSLNYTVTDNAPWLTVSPTSGSSAGEQDTLTVAVDRTGLANNTYTGAITVTPSVGAIINIVVSMTVAQGGTQAPNIQMTATRTAGVSPLGVVFDATATTSPRTTRPFHELDYTWDFGDTGSGNWSTDGKSRNTAKGAVAAHVFELSSGVTSKNYTVTLTVKDSTGASSQVTQVITATDFSGTTYYVSDSTGSDTNTGITQTAPFKTWNKGVSMLFLSNGPRRVLFKQGETFGATAGVNIGGRVGPYIIGTYGSGNRPLVRVQGNIDFILSPNTTSRDLRISDIDFVGPYDFDNAPTIANAGSFFVGRWDDILLSRLKVRGFDVAVKSGGLVDNQNKFIHDCTIEKNYNYNVYGSAKNFSIMGCSFGNVQSEHFVRVGGFINRGVVAHNRFVDSNPTPLNGGANIPFRLHGGDAPPYITQFAIVTSNYFEKQYMGDNYIRIGSGAGGTVVPIVENVIVEGNQFYAPLTSPGVTEPIKIMDANDITVRNNIYSGGKMISFVSAGADYPGANRVHRWHIYHNSVSAAGSTTFLKISSGDAAMELEIINNILYAPTSSFSPLNLSLTTPSNLIEASNIWFRSGSPSSGDPLLTNPNAGDLSLQTNSPAINAGTAIPSVLEDYAGIARPHGAGYDIGAYEQ